ncbi:hypothetical protein KSE1242_23200 (plasmid) [Staphylococcus epidermidis]
MEESIKTISNPFNFIFIQFGIYFALSFILFSLCVLVALKNVSYKEKIITIFLLSFILSVLFTFIISMIVL